MEENNNSIKIFYSMYFNQKKTYFQKTIYCFKIIQYFSLNENKYEILSKLN